MSDENNTSSTPVVPTEKKKVSSTQIILIVGILIILIALGVVGYLVLSKEAPAPEPAAFGTGTVVDDAFDPNLMRDKVADNMFEVNMNAQWNFPDGTSNSTDAYIKNSEANRSPFYVEVVLEEGNELIYTSPKLPIGSAVEQFKLDKDLEPGTYTAVCLYHLLNEIDVVTNTVRVNVTVRVLA